MKKILLADDHAAIRSGIKNILTPSLDQVEYDEVSSVAEILNRINAAEYDLVILDINLPGRSGFDALQQIRDEGVAVPVLVFSFYGEAQIALRALKSGAAGYLSKSASDKELLKAVQQLLNGKKYVSPEVSDLLLDQLENTLNKKPHELLSNREYQALVLLCSGKRLTEIAEILSVSVSTVSTYRARILDKMNLKSNADLIFYAMENKLI